MPMIEIRQLKKSFGSLEVLRDISFSVERGDVIAIIGSSGSGKSTLLRCLINLESIDGGTVLVDGDPLIQDGVYASPGEVRAITMRMGMVFQSFNLFANHTVLENCTLPLITVKRLDRKTAKAIALENLEKVGMAAFQHRGAVELSGGQKQRVAIARALCMEPQLMLFDEPTSALDPEMVGEVLEVVKSLAQRGTTMIIVSHEMTFVRTISTRVLFLDKGVIEEDAPPQELFTNPRSERVKEFLFHHMVQ